MAENSIRLRLKQNEVRRLSDVGNVTETINFGDSYGGKFTYALRVDPGVKEITATLGSGAITVVLPISVAESWIGTDQISIESEQTIGGDNGLRLMIEKDFACLSPRPGEDQSDNFPNPNNEGVC